MSTECGIPDSDLGIALRLSGYLDCQARALGENGFQAMIGGPVATGLLGGIVTLFVALIGYRLLLGRRIGASDAVSRAFRLGIVLALVTAWPAFQTLVYRVAVDGPSELAGVLLPAAGLPSEALDGRVQAAYDTIRLGGTAPSAGAATVRADRTPGPADRQSGAEISLPGAAGLGAGQAPRPMTALLLVVSTLGLTAALKIVVGFLLAIAPLPILALLFDATLGLFAGWASVLAGAALAVLATTVVTALELTMVEGEIASLQAYTRGMIATTLDPQALAVIIVFFGLASLLAAALALRVTAVFRLHANRTIMAASQGGLRTTTPPSPIPVEERGQSARASNAKGAIETPTRAAMLAGVLSQAARYERSAAEIRAIGSEASGRRDARGREAAGAAIPTGFGAAGRRLTARRTRSAATRDRAR